MADKVIQYQLDGDTGGTTKTYIALAATVETEFATIQSTGKTSAITPAGSTVLNAWLFRTPRIETRNGTKIFLGPNTEDADDSYSASTDALVPAAPIAFRGTLAQNLTRYGSIDQNTGAFALTTDPSATANNAADGAYGAPYDGVLKNMQINLTAAPASGQTVVFTVMKNGVATGLVVTMTDADTQVINTVSTLTVAQGDLLALKVLTGATSGAMEFNGSFEYDKS